MHTLAYFLQFERMQQLDQLDLSWLSINDRQFYTVIGGARRFQLMPTNPSP